MLDHADRMASIGATWATSSSWSGIFLPWKDLSLRQRVKPSWIELTPLPLKVRRTEDGPSFLTAVWQPTDRSLANGQIACPEIISSARRSRSTRDRASLLTLTVTGTLRVVHVNETHALLKILWSGASDRIADFWTSNLSDCYGTMRKGRIVIYSTNFQRHKVSPIQDGLARRPIMIILLRESGKWRPVRHVLTFNPAAVNHEDAVLDGNRCLRDVRRHHNLPDPSGRHVEYRLLLRGGQGAVQGVHPRLLLQGQQGVAREREKKHEASNHHPNVILRSRKVYQIVRRSIENHTKITPYF